MCVCVGMSSYIVNDNNTQSGGDTHIHTTHISHFISLNITNVNKVYTQ